MEVLMYVCNGRFCILKELTTNNEVELFRMMIQHSDEYRQTVSDAPIPSLMSMFQEKLRIWFSNGRNYQFLVYSKKHFLSGTVFLYGWNEQTRIVKCSCFFTPNKRKELLAIESLGLVISFAFHFMNIESIYFDVYEDNSEMQKLAHKIGGKKLGCRKSAVNENRTTTSYFLSRDTIARLLDKLERLERR